MKHEPTLPLNEKDITLPQGHFWRKLPALAGIFGVICLLLTIVCFSWMDMPALGSYLIAYLFFLSIAMGGMFFVLIHFATRAGWSTGVRRIAEFALGTHALPIGGFRIPLFLLLFLPIAWGAYTGVLFDWVKHPVHGKEPYLNLQFFFIRAAFYFLVWFLISRYFVSKSLEQDKTGDPEISRRLTFFSPMSIAAFALTLTFAAFDWIMSTDAHWFSTIFGVYYFAGCLISIYSFLALTVSRLRSSGVLKGIVTQEHDHDIGKLLFGFNVFWSYIAFSQFMLIWYSNLPEETAWFATRWEGGWKTLSITLIFGHFVFPFFFLMSRHIKRRPWALAIGAIVVLCMHLLDLYWLIMPNLYHHAHHHKAAFSHFEVLHLVPLATSFFGVGGIFVAAFTSFMQRSNLVPSQDPRLAESLTFENA